MKKDSGTIVRELLDAFNASNLERALAHCTKDARATIVPFGTTSSMREDFQMWKQAFPDAKVSVSQLVATENVVFVEFIGRGTHRGILQSPTGPLPPSNRKMETSFVQAIELDGGKVARVRTYFDALGFFRQMGIGERRAEEAQPAAP